MCYKLANDQLATGSKLRILTVIDTYSRFSLAVVPQFSFRAPDVIEVLDRVCGDVGYPASIRGDQGSEFVSHDLDLRAHMRGVVLDFSQPSTPKDNAFIESFNGKFPGGVLEPAMVHEPRRRGRKMRDLA